jgi:hypothetical protein
MAKKYRIALFGLRADKESFRKNMTRLGVSNATLDKYIERAPVVLKRDLTLKDARKYAEAIINAGGLVNIQETGEFPHKSSIEKRILPAEDFVLCPNCGFRQKRKDFCVRCGFDLHAVY